MMMDIKLAKKKKKRQSQLKDDSDDDLPELDWWQTKPKAEVKKEKKPKSEKSRPFKVLRSISVRCGL